MNFRKKGPYSSLIFIRRSNGKTDFAHVIVKIRKYFLLTLKILICTVQCDHSIGFVLAIRDIFCNFEITKILKSTAGAGVRLFIVPYLLILSEREQNFYTTDIKE